MTKTVRYLEHHPDEWLVGVAGMTLEQNAVFRTICDLIASTRDPIPVEDERLYRIIKANRPRINRAVRDLIAMGKISLIVSKESQNCSETVRKLSQNRVESELKRSENRIERGQKGAAERWKNKDLGDASENATRAKTINHKPQTIMREASPPDQRANAAPAADRSRSANGAAGDLTPEQRAQFDRLRADTLARFAIIPDQPQSVEERQALVDQWSQELAANNAHTSPDLPTLEPTPNANDQ